VKLLIGQCSISHNRNEPRSEHKCSQYNSKQTISCLNVLFDPKRTFFLNGRSHFRAKLAFRTLLGPSYTMYSLLTSLMAVGAYNPNSEKNARFNPNRYWIYLKIWIKIWPNLTEILRFSIGWKVSTRIIQNHTVGMLEWIDLIWFKCEMEINNYALG
jgi:hypothetical protein